MGEREGREAVSALASSGSSQASWLSPRHVDASHHSSRSGRPLSVRGGDRSFAGAAARSLLRPRGWFSALFFLPLPPTVSRLSHTLTHACPPHPTHIPQRVPERLPPDAGALARTCAAEGKEEKKHGLKVVAGRTSSSSSSDNAP